MSNFWYVGLLQFMQVDKNMRNVLEIIRDIKIKVNTKNRIIISLSNVRNYIKKH